MFGRVDRTVKKIRKSTSSVITITKSNDDETLIAVLTINVSPFSVACLTIKLKIRIKYRERMWSNTERVDCNSLRHLYAKTIDLTKKCDVCTKKLHLKFKLRLSILITKQETTFF